jgi:hypothetical protein
LDGGGRTVGTQPNALPAPEPVVQLRGGAFSDDAPVGDDDHPLAERFDLGQDVAREHHRPRSLQAPDELADLDHLPRIKADGGLVEDENRRIAAQRLRDPYPLAIAFRERADPSLGDMLQSRRLEGAEHCQVALRARNALHPRNETQVSRDPQVGIERRVLGEVADGTPTGERIGLRIVPCDPHLPGGRREDPRQHAHGRGLARPVGPQEAHDLAAADRERDPAHRIDRAKRLGEVTDLDHGRRGHGALCCGAPGGSQGRRRSSA